MKGWVAKKGRGFLPACEQSETAHAKMKDGECLQVRFIGCRSVQWNRMYFGICRQIGLNQEPMRSEDSIDAELRVRAGHFDVLLIDGHECRVPRRIAFDQLTADEWAELWLSLDLAIREHFGDEYIGEARKAG